MGCRDRNYFNRTDLRRLARGLLEHELACDAGIDYGESPVMVSCWVVSPDRWRSVAVIPTGSFP
jgi:hypothetical protein